MEINIKIKNRKLRESLKQIATSEGVEVDSLAINAIEQYVKNYEMGKIFDVKFKYLDAEEFITKINYFIPSDIPLANVFPFNDIEDSSDFIDMMRKTV